jgi:hypothetical protein
LAGVVLCLFELPLFNFWLGVLLIGYTPISTMVRIGIESDQKHILFQNYQDE